MGKTTVDKHDETQPIRIDENLKIYPTRNLLENHRDSSKNPNRS